MSFTAAAPASAPAEMHSFPEREYTWGQWRVDIESDAWSLYWALTKTIKESGLVMLDLMEFSDFMAVCKKYTSEPVRPPELPDTNGTDSDDSSTLLTAAQENAEQQQDYASER